MTNLPTCANCHSFSRDGKTFGLDLDGPRNDKGLYALVPVSKKMTISNYECRPLEFVRAERRSPCGRSRGEALRLHVAGLAGRTLRGDLHRSAE